VVVAFVDTWSEFPMSKGASNHDWFILIYGIFIKVVESSAAACHIYMQHTFSESINVIG
jgi:hypothetical protein